MPIKSTTRFDEPIDADDIEMEVIPDEYPDTSYLEQKDMGFEERLEEYKRGKFDFVGVRASLHLESASGIELNASSPGLWGIESDSGKAYFKEVFTDEKAQLIDDLKAAGFVVKNA